MRPTRSCSTAFACAAFTVATAAQDLPRQADWQISLQAAEAVRIRGVGADSPAARAGLRVGDRVLAIDERPIANGLDVARARHRSRAGQDVAFAIERGDERLELTFRPIAVPEERHDGIAVAYRSARTDAGFAVRLIVTRPAGTGPLPAIVFVPWLSCDPVDFPRGPSDGWGRMLLHLVRASGWVVVRIEKSGAGDSDGTSCVDADLEADLAGFRAGLREVARLPGVDTERVFLFGGSVGAALAPVLAGEIPVRGIVAAGGFTKTWLEHMLELERRRLALDGRTPGEIGAAMRGYADFYSAYLNGGATPAEVIARRPDLAPLWQDGPAHQYGRPARYFQQLQALNVARAWENVAVPVLVLVGEFDWIMSHEDAQLVADIVNRRRPGAATAMVVPKMSHHFETFVSLAAAHTDEGGIYAAAATERILQWMHAVAR